MEPQATPTPPTPPIPTPTMPDPYDQSAPTPPTVNTPVPSTPEPIQPPDSKISQKLLIPSIILLVIAVVLVAFKLILTKKVITPPQPTSTPSSQPTPSPIPDPTADWKTYTSTIYEFSFKHPNMDAECCGLAGAKSDKPKVVLSLADITTVIPNTDAPFDGLSIYVIEKGSMALNQYIDKEKVALKEDFEIMANPGQEHVGKVAETEFAGQRAISLIDYSWDGIERSYLEHPNGKYFIEISKKEQSPGHFKTFDQILSTFKFLDQSDAEGKFCGGIAANLPENQCPEGFSCKLEGNYPDASGVCTKN